MLVAGLPIVAICLLNKRPDDQSIFLHPAVQIVRKLIEKGMNETLFCRMNYRNGSASKTSLIQQVAHAETSERRTAGKRTILQLINQPRVTAGFDTLKQCNSEGSLTVKRNQEASSNLFAFPHGPSLVTVRHNSLVSFVYRGDRLPTAAR
jgi:hypothetical protein